MNVLNFLDQKRHLNVAADQHSRYSYEFYPCIKTLAKKFHLPIYERWYGFVRYADRNCGNVYMNQGQSGSGEIQKRNLWSDWNKSSSLNPVLHAFQLIVNHYKIDVELIEAFLHSMKGLDLSALQWQQIPEYHGSAEV